MKWLVICALVFGAYEYRYDIGRFVDRLRGKAQTVHKDAKVTVYSIHNCGICKEFKENLDLSEVKYNLFYLDEDEELEQRVIKRAIESGLRGGVPIVDVGGVMMVNPPISKIKNMLRESQN